jgi:hypothetical protein
VTFKDLKKRVSITHEAQQQSRFFDRLANKPFWIWNIEEHKLADLQSIEDVPQKIILNQLLLLF